MLRRDEDHRNRVSTKWLGLSAAALMALAGGIAPCFGQDVEEPGEAAPAAQADQGGDREMVSFSAFSEPVTLPSLVEWVGMTLGINITAPPNLTGSVVFNTALDVPKSELLPLLDSMLEQQGFGITLDETSGFYIITPSAELPRTFTGDLATTRVIDTPNIRPSSIQNAITQVIGTNNGTVSPVDELGVLIVTASPRQIARVEALVERILTRNAELKLWPIQLAYVAAPTARERVLALAGSPSGGGAGVPQNVRQIQQQQQQQGGAVATVGATLDNLSDRLTIDPQGNTLIFRGTESELDRVMELVELVDRPSELSPRKYFVGGAARQIADIAREQGFGEVVTLDNQTGVGANQFQLNRTGQAQFGTNTETTGGPFMVVDVANGSIIYYGTPAQQEDLAELVEELDTESDRIVIRTYRLNHADAETIAEVLQALISGQTQTGASPFLPQNQQGNNQQAQQAAERARQLAEAAGAEGGGGDGEGEIGSFDPTQVSVIPDAANNQVVIKAPQRQQDDFAELLERLDLRRPQVYVEALIVSVSDTKDFRFAVESQLISGQFGIQSNYGLSSANAGGFLQPRSPATGLQGLTSALVKSDYVPFIINAIQTDTDARILSTPQLLVNDNEQATIVSLEEQPTVETTFGQTTDTQSFSGFQEAGTTLEVTPSISDAGFLRLEYLVELSNFVGTGTDNGIPPPRQTRTVEGLVSIPSDATIVVGGITVQDTRNTIVKIPILGDIPIIGPLFSDTNKVANDSVLYIFITPRIMSDPDFRDIKLFTRGPQSSVAIDRNIPPMDPLKIEIIRQITPATPMRAEPAMTVEGREG